MSDEYKAILKVLRDQLVELTDRHREWIDDHPGQHYNPLIMAEAIRLIEDSELYSVFQASWIPSRAAFVLVPVRDHLREAMEKWEKERKPA
jgi:hypothetical protein